MNKKQLRENIESVKQSGGVIWLDDYVDIFYLIMAALFLGSVFYEKLVY